MSNVPSPATGGGPFDLGSLLTEGSPVVELAKRFAAAGHELYLVGGSVRDAWLGRTRTDLDFSTDASPEETLRVVRPVARNVWLQGAPYGTVGAEIAGQRMEITTFRTERYAPDSRHPEVAFAADVNTDLSRRDFTVNAMAIRLPDRAPVDPFGGAADLEDRILRTPIEPDASFSDDPLRMLRAFRFVAQLDFRIHEDVMASIRKMKDRISTVSAERIRDELDKLLLGEASGRALALTEASGLAKLFLPELSSLRLEQDPVHQHKDVFAHTLAVIERTPPVLELRLAALLHDIGKPKTRRFGPEGVTFHHHEIVGARMAETRLRALRYSNDLVHTVRELIALHHRFHTYRQGWSDAAVRRYVRDAGPLLERLNDLVRADCTTRNPVKARRLAARMDELEARIEVLSAEEELAKIRPDLDGVQVMAYLGVPPGPVIGEALDFLLEMRLEQGPLGPDAAYAQLDEWARAREISTAGQRVPPKEKKPPATS